MKKVGICSSSMCCFIVRGILFHEKQRWFTGIERKSDGGSENQ